MTGPARVTRTTSSLLTALMDRPDRRHHGYDLMKATGLTSGTVYTILARLRGYGWVDAEWEDRLPAHTESRPPRRYYQLTDHGRAEAARVLARGGRR